MTIIVTIALIIWAVSAYKRKREEERRAEQIARINAEMRRRKAEEAYLKAEQKRQDQEQRRQATEQARQAKELERHEAMLLKHEEEIRKLKTQAKLARMDIKAENEKLGNLYALLDIAQQKQMDAHPGSKADEAAMRKVMSLQSQIRASGKRIAKAKDTLRNAERKLKEAVA